MNKIWVLKRILEPLANFLHLCLHLLCRLCLLIFSTFFHWNVSLTLLAWNCSAACLFVSFVSSLPIGKIPECFSTRSFPTSLFFTVHLFFTRPWQGSVDIPFLETSRNKCSLFFFWFAVIHFNRGNTLELSKPELAGAVYIIPLSCVWRLVLSGAYQNTPWLCLLEPWCHGSHAGHVSG